MACTKLMELIDAASMSRVCAECVSGVLMTGMMRLTKLNASGGVHLGICMQVSQICIDGGVLDGVVICLVACDYNKWDLIYYLSN